MRNLSKTDQLTLLVVSLAQKTPGFFDVKGEGTGDRATNAYVKQLRTFAAEHFGVDYGQKEICSGTKFAVDFYIPEEATVIELAFSLHQQMTEYERDIFKCLLAIDCGYKVERLLFIGKPGAIDRQLQSGPRAIAEWAKKQHGLTVDVVEIPRVAAALGA